MLELETVTPNMHDLDRLKRTGKRGWAFDAPLGNPGRYDPKTGISLMTLANNPDLAERLTGRWTVADYRKDPTP